MKTLLTFSATILFISLLGGLLWSCDSWDLPTRKTQRNCVKPSGSLTATAQERKVDFAITEAKGTIDRVIWDFGGGGPNSTTTTTGLTTSYTYPTSSTYTAKATVSNTCGDETIMTVVVSAADALIPTVSLQTPTNVSTNSATAGMTVTSTGNATITRYGICYSSSNQVPAIDKGDLTSDVTASININTPASFTLTNLQPNTTYYVRSFAVNKAGTGYSSSVQTFKTGSLPAISVAGSPTPGLNTATVNFVVTNSGNPAAVEYGILYSSSNNAPTIGNSTVKQVANPAVNANTAVELPNLTANTTYYYRAYAKLASGEIIYSPVQFFATQIDTLAQDLIASVSFTDQSLQDVSGYSNHVKLVNNPTFTTDHTGKPNSAILLDGVDDYFYMPENTNNSLNPEALSVSIWIKPASLIRRMQVYNKSRYEDSAFETYSALMKLENDIGPNITIMTNIKQNSGCQAGKGWLEFPFTSKIELNKWYHLVFTYSGRSARMYLNGLKLYTSDNLPANAMDKCPGAELKFGAAIKGVDWFFNGAMDDIRVYKRALSDSEVQTLYNQ